MKPANQISFTHDQGFTQLVQLHSSRLLLVAFGITRNRQVAEDIVQEAFLRLWQQQSRVAPDNPGGWLYRVVSNLGIHHLKKTTLQVNLLNRLRADDQVHYSDIEERLTVKEKEKQYRMVFSQLTRKQQVVYWLSKEEGLKRNEIATILNLSPNTVKVHLLRAVQFLKEHIAVVILFVFFFSINSLFFEKGNTKLIRKDLYRIERLMEKEIPKTSAVTGLKHSPAVEGTRLNEVVSLTKI